MALTAQDIQRLVPDLTEWLSAKASESLDEKPEEMATKAPSPEYGEKAHASEGAKPDGMGVVIALKPKGAEGGKVEGCPDCADGTPHQHVK